MIDGFSTYNIEKYIDIEECDRNDFDYMLLSCDTLLLIKKYSTETDLAENWKSQMYYVGGYIQANFDILELPQACLWNTYIVYLVDFDITTNLKISIETDKFSCKKYIVDIRNDETANAIVKTLPALTSLILNRSSNSVINDEQSIRMLFVDSKDIDKRVLNYFLNDSSYLNKKIETVIEEMVGIINE